MRVERLAWDSDFFGLRIGKAVIASEEDATRLVSQVYSLKDCFDLIYVFARHGLVFTASKAELVDEKTVYSLKGFPRYEKNSNVMVWDKDRGVTDDLLHLALVSGKYSRFRLDARFPAGSYERLYSRWIEQSVNHCVASEVFCYMEDDAPRGMVTLKRMADVSTVGLVAIHENCQHRGIGSAMMRHVIRFAQEHDCGKLSVTTQLENVSACKLYEKVGFQVESVTDVWHWWL